MMNCSLNGYNVELELPSHVFKPTTTTQLLVNNMGSLKGKTVLDLGCGTGPVAITAALSGAKKVYAVDVMPEACEVAKRNAAHNNVSDRVIVINGDLFEPVHGLKFDIIIDDVSGMAEEVSRLSPWYPITIPTGSTDGTEPTVTMLRESSRYLKDDGVLLFPVISLSRTEVTLSAAREVYGKALTLVTEKMIPFCDELKDNIDKLERLRNDGIIDYVHKRSRYFWKLAIYRAKMQR